MLISDYRQDVMVAKLYDTCQDLMRTEYWQEDIELRAKINSLLTFLRSHAYVQM